MVSNKSIDRLLNANVFKEGESDDVIKFSADFEEKRAKVRATMENASSDKMKEIRRTYVTDTNADREKIDYETLFDAVAVREFADLPRERAVEVAVTFDLFDTELQTTGTPRGFVPLSEKQIDPFVSHNRASIVYFWRKNCDPCDAVREHLAALEQDGTLDDIALGAVYGPNAIPYIRDTFDVAVAPTTLFCFDDRVDSRLIGKETKTTIRKEAEVIRGYLDREAPAES